MKYLEFVFFVLLFCFAEGLRIHEQIDVVVDEVFLDVTWHPFVEAAFLAFHLLFTTWPHLE